MIDANITIDGAATPGYRDVLVTTPEGTDTEADGFTVLAMPTISSVSPTEANQGQTLSITITGTNLLGVTSVGFGSGITVNSFTTDNDTQITASITVSDAAAQGSRDVSVTKAGATATLTSGFAVIQPPPTISSVYPGQLPQGQTLDVTIWGTYLTGASALDFGPDITTNGLTVISATQITANITIGSSATPGARVAFVTTPGGTAAVTGFSVLATPTMATISSVSPSQAEQGQVLNVTITGTRLLGVTTVGFGSGITVNSFTVDSDTQITASIAVSGSAAVGTRDVSVTKAAGTVTLTNGFTVLADDSAVVDDSPDIALLSPASGKQGANLEVIITGANFTGATEVSFGEGVTVDGFTVDSATQITAQISIAAKAAPGTREVSVNTPEGSGTVAEGFQIKAKAGAIPMYFWLLVPATAAAGLLVLAFVIRRKKKQAAS